MLNLIVQRGDPSPSGLSWPGELLLNDSHLCFTLERGPGVKDHPPIPFGTYDGVLSVSPHLHYLCPLLAVPGRTGIRIHVANWWHELQGCTAVGLTTGVEAGGHPNATPGEFAVYESRAALDELLRVLQGPFVITYRPKGGTT
jgi:hypothetical protein